MATLAAELSSQLRALVSTQVALTPQSVRGIVEGLGGGTGRREIARGNKELAAQLGVSVRTVQRWQKEPGTGETRAVTRNRNQAVVAQVQMMANTQQQAANIEQLRTAGLTVEECECWVKVSNEERERRRMIRRTPEGDPIHLDGETMGAVLDAIELGEVEEAAELFGEAVLYAYGITESAEITEVGTLRISY